MRKILVISPYIGLKELILEVNKELKKDIDIYIGDLEEGLHLAKSLLRTKDYDVIISRGATAKLLKRNLSIPVMEIPMTGYDILRTLTLLKGFSGKIGMMSYLNNIPGANTIGQLLNMDITFYPISEDEEIEKEIERAAEEGVQVIIGDVISTTTAAKFGIQAILITSGKEAILDVFSNLNEMFYYANKEKEYKVSLEKAFEHVNSGALVFDSEGQCIFINKEARKYLHLHEKTETMTFETLKTSIPQLNRYLRHEDLTELKPMKIDISGESLHVELIPLDNGAFAMYLQKKTATNIKREHEHRAYYHFHSFVTRSEQMNQLINVAKKVSHSDLPIIIYGETGVGKNSLAQAIHNNSERKTSPYVFINCKAYSESQLERTLFGYAEEMGAIELADGGTLFLDAIGSLPYSLQGKLLRVITTKQVQSVTEDKKKEVDIRFVVANNEVLDHSIKNGRLREDLYNTLNGFILKIPPLRERNIDVEDFIRIFIASMNASLKKQISGVHPDVLERLKSFQWPGNVQQLKRVVEQMCMMSNGPFIEIAEVQSLLKKLKEEEQSHDRKGEMINIHHKTLQQIEDEIILSVLKQEDFNQSQAARRLGINRSTLWRKIKQMT